MLQKSFCRSWLLWFAAFAQRCGSASVDETVLVPITKHAQRLPNVAEKSLMRAEGGTQVYIDMHGGINKTMAAAGASPVAERHEKQNIEKDSSSEPTSDSAPHRILADFNEHKEVSENSATTQPTTELPSSTSSQNLLVQTTKATTTTLEPLLCNEYAGYKLCRVMQGFECRSSDVNMSNQATLSDCAARVYEDSGRFMVYGTGPKATECFKEMPSAHESSCYEYQDAASCCPELWEEDSYNYYIIIPVGVENHIQNACGRNGVHLISLLLTLFAALACYATEV